jgi:competence protein ComEC
MWRIAAGALAGSCSFLTLVHGLAAPRLAGLVALLWLLALASRRPWLVAGAVAVTGTAAHAHLALADRLDPGLEGQWLRVRGTVVSVPQGPLEVLRFRFEPDAEPARRLPKRLELTWYDAPAAVVAAERLELEVRLRRPRGFANPGGTDNEARMLRERIGASGYVRTGRSLGRGTDAAWRHPVLLARARVHEVVRDVLHERPAAGIVSGLAVGLQDALSRDQWRTLARSGTSHLMAISGLHIAMVAAMAAWAGGRVQRWRQRRGATTTPRDAAVIAGACAALGYSLLAGWSVPTQRTLVMLALAALALVLRRRTGVADGLGACVLGVLLLDPLAPLAPGFWLSFGAVAAILFAATGYVRKPSLFGGYLQVQAAVTIGLVPMLVGSFGTVSLVSALVNLYAIPLYTLLVVPAVLLSCAVAVAWAPAGEPLLRATAALIEATWPLIELPTHAPLASWTVAALDPVAWLALGLGAVGALAPLPVVGRLAGAAIAVTACLWRPPLVAPGEARITMLDVGQGLAVVVETRAHTLVYDAGPSFRTGSDTGQLVVVPYLRHRGVRAIDVLAVSHDDDDHAGGVASVLEAIPVARLAAGPSVPRTKFDAAATTPAEWQRCRRGERWNWDGVGFEWLHPGAGPYERDNDGSCVLRVSAGRRSALITGDVEARAEAEMLEHAGLAAADVVVVPHHGSRTSSSPAFVERARPRWAVYAVGYRNRWGFPKAQVVERWREAGARDLRTSTSGAVTFVLRPGTAAAAPGQWRIDAPRIWRDP